MQGTLKDIVSEIRSLEPFPGVALKVLELSGQKDVVPNELISIIQTDAGLTGKVLKLCNSAYYGFQREIASLQEAGNLLGVQTLVNLVLTSSTNRYFRDYGGAEDDASERLWRNSVATAIAARMIASRDDKVDEGDDIDSNYDLEDDEFATSQSYISSYLQPQPRPTFFQRCCRQHATIFRFYCAVAASTGTSSPSSSRSRSLSRM